MSHWPAAIGAAAQPYQPAQKSSGALRLQQPGQLMQALPDRLGLRVRPSARPQEPVVHPAEPRHLQQLFARHFEDEGGEAESEQLYQEEDTNRAKPITFR